MFYVLLQRKKQEVISYLKSDTPRCVSVTLLL